MTLLWESSALQNLMPTEAHFPLLLKQSSKLDARKRSAVLPTTTIRIIRPGIIFPNMF